LRKTALRGVAVVWWCSLGVWLLGGYPVPAQGQAAPRITVTVDPRVELMSIIFYLAGSKEYDQGRVPSYIRDVDSHFGRVRDHAVVKLARKLRATRGISYDDVVDIAVHVTDVISLPERVPFFPLPKSMDRRWTTEAAREFLVLARLFVVESEFQRFFNQHQPLYQAGVRNMQEALRKYAHLEWFERFFGFRQGADFCVILGLLTGTHSYAARLAKPDGREDLYSVTGVWAVDAQGQPTFSAEVIPIIVHELTHSYTNPLVDQFAKGLRGPGETLFPFVRSELEKQAYGNWRALMCESLDRACTLRYILANEGPAALQERALYESTRGFPWTGELAAVLAEYDTKPRAYSDLAQFFPRIIAFFNDYAKNADTKLGSLKAQKDRQRKEWQEKGPQIVALVPAHGAQDVDPRLKAIVVTFDRRMRDKSWSVVSLGSTDRYPQEAGPAGYDAARKVFTLPVELQPGKEYAFGLNAERYLRFQSEEGIPLAPVEVHFKTRPADK